MPDTCCFFIIELTAAIAVAAFSAMCCLFGKMCGNPITRFSMVAARGDRRSFVYVVVGIWRHDVSNY